MAANSTGQIGAPLTSGEINVLYEWIEGGCQSHDGSEIDRYVRMATRAIPNPQDKTKLTIELYEAVLAIQGLEVPEGEEIGTLMASALDIIDRIATVSETKERRRINAMIREIVDDLCGGPSGEHQNRC